MRVVIFAGPTGGHFYPALAFAAAFRKRHPETELVFVTGERGRPLAEKARSEFGGRFEFIPDFPFPRPRDLNFLIRAPGFLLKLARAFLKCCWIVGTFKPNLAVGFGSYVSGPGIWLSSKKGIPTLIHEQNRTMGRANAWARRFADAVALTFEENPPRASRDKRSPLGIRHVVTGIPLRRALVERAIAKERVKSSILPRDRLRILILGGSQGSHALNLVWRGVIEGFSDEEKEKVAVIHITGDKDFEAIKKMYFEKGIESLVYKFHGAMEEFYGEADLAITRAGAGTLFELALFGLPAIVVPYPHADRHQELNARYFEERGGLTVLPEAEATPERLRREILSLMDSEERRSQESKNLVQLARPGAADELVKTAEKLLL